MGGRHNKADYSKGRQTLSHLAPDIFRELYIITLQGKYPLSDFKFSFDMLRIMG